MFFKTKTNMTQEIFQLTTKEQTIELIEDKSLQESINEYKVAFIYLEESSLLPATQIIINNLNSQKPVYFYFNESLPQIAKDLIKKAFTEDNQFYFEIASLEEAKEDFNMAILPMELNTEL